MFLIIKLIKHDIYVPTYIQTNSTRMTCKQLTTLVTSKFCSETIFNSFTVYKGSIFYPNPKDLYRNFNGISNRLVELFNYYQTIARTFDSVYTCERMVYAVVKQCEISTCISWSISRGMLHRDQIPGFNIFIISLITNSMVWV